MGQEKEILGEETRLEPAKHIADGVKLSQGLLSFRSRKLLRSRLSKTSSSNYVDKLAAVLPATESADLEPSGSHPELVHGEPPKACRKLWDSRTTELDSSNSRPRSSSRQSKKLEGIHSIRDKQVDEGSAPRTIENDSANSRTRSSSRQSKKLQGSPPIEEQEVGGGSVKGAGVVLSPSSQQLSPRFKLLDTFYESLEAACSLLRIRRQMCTFRAVRKIVESMSKRRFLLKHLAQIKHIFSEVLQFEYVRCQDPDSWGERWDLRVTILPLSPNCLHTSSPLKGSAGQTAQTVRRRKEFHARLLSFQISHPEDGDIPPEPLPQRPYGSPSAEREAQLAGSPSTDGKSDSFRCAQSGVSEASAQLPDAEPCTQGAVSEASTQLPDADPFTQGGVSEATAQLPDPKPPIQIRTEDFEFIIVKPSRGNDTAPLAGTSHFPSSFRPVYSNIQTADISRDAAVPSTNSLPLDSHFPASFRPSFSARTTSVAVGCLSMQPPKRILFENNPLTGSRYKANGLESRIIDQNEEIRVASQVGDKHGGICVESRVGDKHEEICVESRVASGDPALSSGPVSVNSSSPSDNSSYIPPSTPVPSPYAKDLLQGSTEKGSPALHASDFSFSPRPIHTPPFVSPMNRKFSSDQDSLNETPCKTPSTNSSRDQVHPKSQGIMRSLRFASPVKSSPLVKAENCQTAQRAVNSPVKTPPSNTGPVHASVRTLSTINNSSPGAPETPSLQTPVRIRELKETWYSPPKRTKLNLASLFTNDKGEDEGGASQSNTSFSTEIGPEAWSEGAEPGGDFRAGPHQQSSMSLKSHPTSKETEGVSESDLDVIQCLPHDVVQSVWEKERKMKDKSSQELAQLKRRQQMMSGVPKLFNQLRLIFQSLNRSVLPESELLRTILTSHPELTDKGEIDERLKLVVELAPDYINTRPSHSGELLYRVDKRADVVQIQRRLSGGPGRKLF